MMLKGSFVRNAGAPGIRFDAKTLGYPMSYYAGGRTHNFEEDACVGCYWYDPLEFKRHLTEKKD